RGAAEDEWEGMIIYGAEGHVDELEEGDIGIQGLASSPVGADGYGRDETDVPVSFGAVTF
ncbi:hypothetical protein J2R62_17545, partial [Plesiomonas shigelloides]|nr:hypothetical protein [Plesiomonas shigelloides]